ncbi:DUF805 domain-containing protein [Formicincola oecophyllae]|uniref:DUF805 domain-containing protein n=1 Tax=Formicincola oecophyllae TaxID=2558361 RepID=A0A4Y6UCM3_9PROT|nr:DUF805 domain-containing protein [Formicincola oecophyllae]QDH14187.1 DUF805 domain-containing protein [Formicincola oecophyllae]
MPQPQSKPSYRPTLLTLDNLPRNGWQWFLRALRRSLVFGGRATRREYGWFVFWAVLLVAGAWFAPLVGHEASVALGLFLALPFLAATTRRLHDAGYSGKLLASGLFLMMLAYGCTVPLENSQGIQDLGPAAAVEKGITWFLGIFALVGGAVLVLFMLRPSQPGANRFGPNPYAALGLDEGVESPSGTKKEQQTANQDQPSNTHGQPAPTGRERPLASAPSAHARAEQVEVMEAAPPQPKRPAPLSTPPKPQAPPKAPSVVPRPRDAQQELASLALLEQYAALHSKGVLTDAEFKRKKAQLLSSPN